MAAWTHSAADHELQRHSNKQMWQTGVKHLRHRKTWCLDKYLSQPKYPGCLLIQQGLTSLWYDKTYATLKRCIEGCYIKLRNKLSSNVKTLEVLRRLSVFVHITINFQITCILFGSFRSHSEFEELLLSTQYPNAELEVQWGCRGFVCLFVCFWLVIHCAMKWCSQVIYSLSKGIDTNMGSPCAGPVKATSWSAGPPAADSQGQQSWQKRTITGAFNPRGWWSTAWRTNIKS